jgi:hypothetical protein
LFFSIIIGNWDAVHPSCRPDCPDGLGYFQHRSTRFHHALEKKTKRFGDQPFGKKRSRTGFGFNQKSGNRGALKRGFNPVFDKAAEAADKTPGKLIPRACGPLFAADAPSGFVARAIARESFPNGA